MNEHQAQLRPIHTLLKGFCSQADLQLFNIADKREWLG